MQDETRHREGHVLAGRYEILSEIGRGGFGMVYRGRQMNMDREVAIKILPPQFMAIGDVVARFRREAQLASRLKHPNTITVHDYGQDQGLLYIVMELLHGEDIADLLKHTPRLPPERILHIARQILKSLAEAHKHSIVHRDLKPENIFLEHMDGETDFVKVLDFGIAKLAQPEAMEAGKRLTVMGSTVGTPVYMSPEQAAGEEVDHQTDLYALGVIMYEMACGRPPFCDDNPVKVMRSHLFEPVPPFEPSLGYAGSRLEEVIMKALQKEKLLRYQSALEFLEALDHSRPEIAVMPTGLFERISKDVVVEELETTAEMQGGDSAPIDLSLYGDTSQFDAITPHGVDTGGMVPFQEASSSSEEMPQEHGIRVPSQGRPEEMAHARGELTLAEHSGLTVLPPLAAADLQASSISSILQVISLAPQEDVVVLNHPKGGQPIDDAMRLGKGGQAPLHHGPIQVDPGRPEPEPDEPVVLDTPRHVPVPAGGGGDRGMEARGWSWGEEGVLEGAGRRGALEERPGAAKRRGRWAVGGFVMLLMLAVIALYLWGNWPFR